MQQHVSKQSPATQQLNNMAVFSVQVKATPPMVGIGGSGRREKT